MQGESPFGHTQQLDRGSAHRLCREFKRASADNHCRITKQRAPRLP